MHFFFTKTINFLSFIVNKDTPRVGFLPIIVLVLEVLLLMGMCATSSIPFFLPLMFFLIRRRVFQMPALVILQTLTGTFEDSFQFFMLSFFVFGVVLTNRFIIIAVVVIVVMLLLFGFCFGFGFGVLLC